MDRDEEHRDVITVLEVPQVGLPNKEDSLK